MSRAALRRDIVRRWCATADERDLGLLIERWGAQQALEEGRVFAGEARLGPSDLARPLSAGTWVELRQGRAVDTEPAIVAQFDDAVVVNKPAAWPSEPDRSGSLSVVAWLTRRSGQDAHIASRLDVGVSGLLTAALTEKGRRRLVALQEKHALHRCYLGIAVGHELPERGHWSGRVATPRGLQDAATAFRVLSRVTSPSRTAHLVELQPATGRFHQLRQHCQLAGAPLLGDRRHGGLTQWVDTAGRVTRVERLALHSWQLAWKEELLQAPPPEDFGRLWRLVGGEDAAWQNLSPSESSLSL